MYGYFPSLMGTLSAGLSDQGLWAAWSLRSFQVVEVLKLLRSAWSACSARLAWLIRSLRSLRSFEVAIVAYVAVTQRRTKSHCANFFCFSVSSAVYSSIYMIFLLTFARPHHAFIWSPDPPAC